MYPLNRVNYLPTNLIYSDTTNRVLSRILMNYVKNLTKYHVNTQ